MKNIFVICFVLFVLNGNTQNEVAFLRKKLASYTSIQQELIQAPYKQIPLLQKDGFILIKSKVDGKEGFLIFDSGAPSLVINKKVEKSVDTANGLNGDLKVDYGTIKQLEWAGIQKEDVECILLDLDHLEQKLGLTVLGLLGFEIASKYEILIDYPQELITINYKGDQSIIKQHPARFQIPFELKEHLPIINAQIQNEKTVFALDTGAGTNLLDPNTKEKFDSTTYELIRQEQIRGLDKKVKLEDVIEIDDNQFYGFSVEKMPYLITELNFVNQTLNTDIDGILGYSFFQDLKFSINYKDQMLYIW